MSASVYLLLVAGVLLHGWFAPRGATVATVTTSQQGGDRLLFDAVVHRLERGEPYYAAMGTELQARGYPTASVFNWRTPFQLSLLASVTSTGGRVILAALAIAALALLMPASPSPRGVMFAVGVPLLASTILVALSEAWAGTLIALSLGAYARKQWALAALCGVLAVFMRELAVVYALAAAVTAVASRRKAESLTWICGGALYLTCYAWHVQNVLAAIPQDAQAHGASWIQWGGLAFIYRTVECYGWATLAPSLAVPLVIAAGLLGVVSAEMPIQARLALIGYLGAFATVGLPINRYWGLVTVPLWGLAALHAMSGVQRLYSAWNGLPADSEPTAGMCTANNPVRLMTTGFHDTRQ